MWAIISLTRTKVKAFLYSIRWKILIAYLLIISIAFSVVAATLIQLVGDYMFNQRVRDDQRVAENLSSIMGEALFSLDVGSMLLSAADASSAGVSRVLVLDRYGVVMTPGAGFGPSGEGFMRISCFGDADETKRGIEYVAALCKEIEGK